MVSVDTFLDFLHNISSSQAFVLTVSFMIIFYYSYWQYRDIPPGPRGIPLLGYWPFLFKENVHLHTQDLKEKYGDIYSLNITGHLYIMLCNMKLIKEAHISKSESFHEKFDGYSLITLSLKDGVAVANGESWKIQRKFYLQKFKEYGMMAMKENYSGVVYDTLKETIDEMRDMKGKPFPVGELLTLKCYKIIRRILFNDQGISEEELKEINQEYQPVLLNMTLQNLLLVGNIARFLVFPFMPSYWAMLRGHRRIQDILRNVIKRHKDNFDETQIMDIIDCYFKEKKDRERKGDPTAKYFTDEALISSVYEFVSDGALTVAYFIGMFLRKLVQSPEEQEKIYEELLDVLGPDREPTVDDKTKLPYTNAFIYEVIRHYDYFPFFPSVKCAKETTIQGYRIPKGTITIVNHWCASHDPKVYEDPYTFNPSRFISVPGKQKAEIPIIFGVGKRNCIGEPLVMNEVFLFLSTIVKNFSLTMPQKTSSTMATVVDVTICAHPREQRTKIE